MWPTHREVVFRNHCVRSRSSLAPMPRVRVSRSPRAGRGPPGKAGRYSGPSVACLQDALMAYFETMLDLALQSNGEDEQIKVSVSPMIKGEDPHCHGYHRAREDTPTKSQPRERPCKQAWESNPECNQMCPDLSCLEPLFDWTFSMGRIRNNGMCVLDRDENDRPCPVHKDKDKTARLLGRVTDQVCPLHKVKDQQSQHQSKVIGKGLCSLCKIKGEGSCYMGKVMDQGLCPLHKVKDQESCPLGKGERSYPLGRVEDEETRPLAKDQEPSRQGKIMDRLCEIQGVEPFPLGKVKDQGSYPLGEVKNEGTCPLARVKVLELRPLDKVRGQGSCLLDKVGGQGSCSLPRGQGPSPLHWMWEGFSVDRYAPRRRPTAAAGGESEAGAGGLSQIRLLTGGRRRTPPAGQRQVGESGPAARAACGQAAPLSNAAVARATGRQRRAQAQPLRREDPQRAAVAPGSCSEFLRLYRQVVEEAAFGRSQGDGGAGDQRRRTAGGPIQLKVTKLVQQRHELVRKNLMEKERQELMEQRKLFKERMKRRKTGRLIAARLAVCEMDKWRRTQARKKLQCFRKCNREQAALYQLELKEMKERVARAPFLFEQVIQNNVRGTIGRLFTKVLQKLRLDEELVCKLGTADSKSDTQLVDLESADWEGVCAMSHSEGQRHAACEEPLDTGSRECDHEGDSIDSPGMDPAIDC